MIRLGFIGTGSMGSMLIKKFIETKSVSSDNILAYNRSPEKLRAVADVTGISAAESNIRVVEKSEVIFVCVRPCEVKDVLMEIKDHLCGGKVVVSVASDVSLDKICEWSGTNAVRVIPSITSESLAGVSVISFGEGVSNLFREEILHLFDAISRPYVTGEENMALLSDVASSSPAIIAAVIREFAMAAARRGKLSPDEAQDIVKEVFLGTAKLFSEKGFSFDSLISRVSTEGGITAEGVCYVKENAPHLFDNVLLKMSEKHESVKNQAETDK